MAQKKSASSSGTSSRNGKSSQTAKSTQTSKTGTKAGAASKSEAAVKTGHSRGVNVLVFFVLGVFSFLGYFNNDGIFIRILHGFFTGLLGNGFYLLPPVLIACAVIYAVSGDRPHKGRIFCLILLPVLLGAFFQLFSKADYSVSIHTFSALWEDGRNLSGGGAVSGMIETVLEVLFSRVGAGIVIVCAAVVSIFCITGLTLQKVVERIRRKAENRKNTEAEYVPSTAVKNEPVPDKKTAKSAKKVIDIPIDDTAQNAENNSAVKERKPLFNKKSNAMPPDELLRSSEDQGGNIPDFPDIEIIPLKEQTASAANNDSGLGDSSVKSSISDSPEYPEETSAGENISEAEPEAPEAESPGPAAHVKKKKTTEKSSSSETVENDESKISGHTDNQEDALSYRFPPLSLLEEPKTGSTGDAESELEFTKDRLEHILHSFGINSEINNIVNGPAVTRYEMELEIGVKLNKLTSLSEDIALALGVGGVRIAAIPNKISTVGIEVPNKHVSTVYLREIISSQEFQKATSKLTFALGKNIGGEVVLGNISKLPHLLVAGTTGSGKSVCLNSMILSMMYKAGPDEVKFIMIDPKMVEFKIYNGIPHLLVPVVTEAKKAAGALQWAVTEMMKRYRLFAEVDAREIVGYNEKIKQSDQPAVPYIVVIIDELADLMMVAAKEVEESICRIAQMGRAAGVHLVIATQSPRADVITGLMKANIPSRIAFKVASGLESRIILDSGGSAETLMGNGDMLFAPIGTTKPERIQGTWVSDGEREKIINFIKNSYSEVSYSDDVINQIERAAEDKTLRQDKEDAADSKNYDELLTQAVDVIFDTNQASVSMLQRRLKLGYARAARLVDQMEEIGIVGPFEGSKPRQILITRQQWQEMQFINGTAPPISGHKEQNTGKEEPEQSSEEVSDNDEE